MKTQYIILAVLAAVVYYEFRRMDAANAAVSVPVPQNPLGIATAPPNPSVSNNSSVLSSAQSGTGLFNNPSGLGNNPVPQPTSGLGATLANLQSGQVQLIPAPDESSYVAPANAVSKLLGLTGQEAYNADNEVGDYTPGSFKNPFAANNYGM
jgi:hypothetical protein